jgi:hypothetical protein
MERYAFAGSFDNVVPIGLTPAGLRIDVGLTGAITEGPLTNASICGTDRLLLRHDGIGQVDVHERITVDGQVVASLRFMGYVVPSIPMPELTALLSPDFTWPDMEFPLHGAAFFEYAIERLQPATATVYGAQGAVNLGAGTIRLSATSLRSSNAQLMT